MKRIVITLLILPLILLAQNSSESKTHITGLRFSAGGQWMFNSQKSGTSTRLIEYAGGTKTDTLLLNTDIVPETFIPIELGVILSNNQFWGLYGELFCFGAMVVSMQEWQLKPAMSIGVGSKGGYLRARNSYSFDNYTNGVSNGISSISHTANVRYASVDMKLALGKRNLKFVLLGSLWFGKNHDIDSPQYAISVTNSQNGNGDFITHTSDYDYRVSYPTKFAVMPAFSAMLQLDILPQRWQR